MKPNLNPSIQELEKKRLDMIATQRVYGRHFKKLRALPKANVDFSNYWGKGHLTLNWHLTVLSMQQTEKFLEKWSTIFPLEAITTTDQPSGTRLFKVESKGRFDAPFKLTFQLFATPEDGNKQAKCRKVQVGMETNTYTSTSPKYEIVCDEA